tara:strand:- start:6278 stop:7915 length:1638 start_codon:yes stop_codon:yes gene_type:complete
MNKNLILIIARDGNSQHVSKQNLRLVNGKPLIYYVIKAASDFPNSEVIVSTDSSEIKYYSKFYNIQVLDRPKRLTLDNTKLEEIVSDVLNKLKNDGKIFEKCLILHPHFPLIKKATIKKFFSNITDNVNVVYGYEKTSESDTDYREIRSSQLYKIPKKIVKIKKIVAFDSKKFLKYNSFGKIHHGIELSSDELFTPENYHDFASLESRIKRKKIIIRVDGHSTIGLGHVYNMLTVLNNLRNEDILIVMNKNRSLGSNKFKEHLYNVKFFSDKNSLWKIIENFKPDIVFNDILDTDPNYMKKLKRYGIFTVNFEDSGKGKKFADLVFNPIYEKTKTSKNEFYGHKFACVREEFRVFQKMKTQKNIKKVAITLGGVDKDNNTLKVLSLIKEFNLLQDVELIIILGFGFKATNKIKNIINLMNNQNYKINLLQDVELLSSHLIDCDFVITSNGRTVFEILSLNIPVISLSVNEREAKHNFIKNSNLGINLNFYKKNNKNEFKNSIIKMTNFEFRKKKFIKIKQTNLRRGVDIVTSKIISNFELNSKSY